jgi:hypothetical protein
MNIVETTRHFTCTPQMEYLQTVYLPNRNPNGCEFSQNVTESWYESFNDTIFPLGTINLAASTIMLQI